MDFRFDQPITLTKQEGTGLLIPVDMQSQNISKSKLNVSYITAPLILEIATPLKFNHHRLSIGAGVIGAVNVGSRTKVKIPEGKTKDRRNFNIHPFKYELTGRIGLGELSLFANYGMSPIFREGKGPEIAPLTVGVAFPNISF
jgi:hypothetical protein